VRRAKKICPHVGADGTSCTKLQPCPDHGRKPWAGSARDQGLHHLSGSARQKRNRGVLDRADTICALCGYPGADEVDHVVPLAHGGTEDISNCQAVHKACHATKTQREARGGGQ
jgi:5-methylcytosine-specific restriction protein A